MMFKLKKTIRVDLILAFIIIFVSEDTILFGTNINDMYIYIRYILYLILYIVLLRERKKVYYIPNLKFYIITYVFFVISAMLINSDYRTGYFLQILLVLLSIEIASKVSFYHFSLKYSEVLFFFAVCSIGIMSLFFLIPQIFSYFPIISNYGDVKLYNLYVCMVFCSTEVIRNTGIFREPGVFIIYLIVALMIEFFVIEKPRWKYVVVFIVALLMSKSTAGYITLILLLSLKMYLKGNLKQLIIFALSALIVALILFPYIENDVFSKLNDESSNYSSTLSRISSIVIPLQIWRDYPFCSIGLGRFATLYSIYSLKEFGFNFSADAFSTNTLLNTIVIYSPFLGGIITYALYRLSLYMNRKGRFILLFIFILLFSNEEMRMSLLYNILIVYGLMIKSENYLPIK